MPSILVASEEEDKEEGEEEGGTLISSEEERRNSSLTACLPVSAFLFGLSVKKKSSIYPNS